MKWTKPQLIVIARGMPEESVLTHCKTQNPTVTLPGPEDTTQQQDCAAGPDEANCSNCLSRAFDTT